MNIRSLISHSLISKIKIKFLNKYNGSNIINIQRVYSFFLILQIESSSLNISSEF